MPARSAARSATSHCCSARDPKDPRQFECETYDYLAAIGKGAKGLEIALVKEGFGRPESEAAVDAKVRAGAARFRELGAEVSEVSIPMHEDGIAIWTAIAAEGAAELMIKGNGTRHELAGLLSDRAARGLRRGPPRAAAGDRRYREAGALHMG
jgi:amidase